MERLQKALARAGVASRRKAEELIAAGAVRVNGRTVTVPGTQVEIARDTIEVEGRRISCSQSRTYLMLHKPAGVVTTRRDPHGRRTILDLLPAETRHLHPVGRLDAATEGLLLVTDDGNLTHRLTHPRHGVGKTYRAEVRGCLGDADVRRLAQGLILDDGPTAPCRARVVRRGAGTTVVELTIHEGRKRQVRRMLAAVGHPVTRLLRTCVGRLNLGRLRPGEFRELTEREVTCLFHDAS